MQKRNRTLVSKVEFAATMSLMVYDPWASFRRALVLQIPNTGACHLFKSFPVRKKTGDKCLHHGFTKSAAGRNIPFWTQRADCMVCMAKQVFHELG